MYDEQLERFKEFMLRQQAESAERVIQMEDLLVRFAQATRERLAANDRWAQEMDEKFAALTNAQIRAEDRAVESDMEAKQRAAELDRKFAALTDAQIRAEDRAAENDREAKERAAENDREAKEHAADFDRKIAALVDAQMRTEETVKKMGERIDNLVMVVERHVADGHGGRAQTGV